MKVVLGVSNRHVHLTKEVFEKLFGENAHLEVRNNLGQPGQFASTSTVDIKVGDNVIEHVRIIGPLRHYNQIEISQTDANYLGVNPPRRQSGDLDGSLPITIIGPVGSVDVESGLILAERHIHMEPKMAHNIGLEDKELVHVYRDGEHLFDAAIKYSDPGSLELHIDTDEANQYNLKTKDILEFDICSK